MLIIFAVEIKPFLVVVFLKIPEKADGRRAEHDAKLTFCRQTRLEKGADMVRLVAFRTYSNSSSLVNVSQSS
jgi:hypothetical protein